MSETIRNISDQEREALKFLERDFNQCFQQMRHYDSQIFDILKFMFTAYTALIGVALGLYQFGVKEKIYLIPPAIAALIIGLVLGAFMFYLVLINRAYYVRVARYINEQRNLFLSFKPLGFENISRMYTNAKQPYFSRESSQVWLLDAARKEAFDLVSLDPELAKWPLLKQSISAFWEGKIEIFETV